MKKHITKTKKLIDELIDKRILTGAQVEIMKTSDFDGAWLVDDEYCVVVTQEFTYDLSVRASDMYMVIGHRPHGYRVYHNGGFYCASKFRYLGAVIASHWEAKRSELIYSGSWSRDK